MSFGFAVDGLVDEEACEFGVLDNHGRIILNGVEVFFLEAVAIFRRSMILRAREMATRESMSVTATSLERASSMWTTNSEMLWSQGRGIWVVDDEAEELTSGDGAVLLFVTAALHIEERLMKTKERLAKSDELLTGGGIPCVSLIELRSLDSATLRSQGRGSPAMRASILPRLLWVVPPDRFSRQAHRLWTRHGARRVFVIRSRRSQRE